jgi:hypothetical protein
MAGDDPSDRFEYLFDPVAGDSTMTTTEAPAARPVVSEVQATNRRRPLLLAAAAVLGAAVACLLVWPEPVEAGKTPTQPGPEPSTPQATTSQRADEPSNGPAPAPLAVPSSVAPAPRQAPAPGPPSSSLPTTRVPPPQPTVRAPISVSPAPRQAFPNENPKTGNGGGPHGGLLGGGGLL